MCFCNRRNRYGGYKVTKNILSGKMTYKSKKDE